MKKLLIISLLLLTFTIHSQKYTFKKVVMNDNYLKMKGTVHFTDSLITIKMKGFDTAMPVRVTSKHKLLTRYEMKTGTDTYSDDVRLSLTPDALSKKGGMSFIMEVKDNFSGSYQVTTYLLLPAEEED